MQKNLVIVESPAKAKTIGRFLGDDFKVMSSYGHIRDLKTKAFSIDTDTFQPEYEIPEDKQQVVAALRTEAQKADQVWLASDEDREGEAISWHLAEVLGLDVDKTKRIVFHEITQNAIQEAVKSPRTIDRNLVNAQQARRVLDRIVGFKLSPVLWHKVKPALSAGRVQSVAVRLVADREKEIKEYRATSNFAITAIFEVIDSEGNVTSLKAELSRRFQTKEEARAFLESCENATFHVGSLATKPVKRIELAAKELKQDKKQNPQNYPDDSIFNKKMSEIKSGELKDGKIPTLTIVIKPTDNASYKNVVDALDEMQILSIGTYVIDKLSPDDEKLLKLKGVEL